MIKFKPGKLYKIDSYICVIGKQKIFGVDFDVVSKYSDIIYEKDIINTIYLENNTILTFLGLVQMQNFLPIYVLSFYYDNKILTTYHTANFVSSLFTEIS